jgi:NAD-dependent deacetylase
METINVPKLLLNVLSDRNVRIVVSTGAGVSAESGVPTFRSAGGLWKTYRAEQLATPEAFAENPDRVWEWYEYRRGMMAKCKPNPGHEELARWEQHFTNFTLITQNIDGLHRAAGSSQPIELHGNIKLSRCHLCGQVVGEVGLGENGEIPMCRCGGPVRPAVVWFGEPLPQREIQLAWDACRKAEVFFSVGTSGVVQPAASLAAVAKDAGAYLVEVNPEDTEVSYFFDAVLRYPSGVILPEIGQRLGVERG